MDTTQAETLARDLMAKHLYADWNFSWSQRKVTLGRCIYTTKTIELSMPLTLVNDEAEMRDTILHEIAHALAGGAAGHGPEWRYVARRLGATPRATTSVAATVPSRYEATCPVGHIAYSQRRPSPKRLGTSCGVCSPRFNRAYRRRWVDLVTQEVLRDFGETPAPGFVPVALAARKISPAPSRPRAPRTAPVVGYTDIESLFAGD